jgi:hypothetical protein
MKMRDDLTRRLKKDIADHFEVGKTNVVEQRRLMWTTAYNLEVWFKTWKNTLIELGFGRAKTMEDVALAGDGSEPSKGEVIFYVGQRDRRIGNIDETDGSLDDTTGQRGGLLGLVTKEPCNCNGDYKGSLLQRVSHFDAFGGPIIWTVSRLSTGFSCM